jgi:DNA-directed RNA polymerase specialized sigma24 family protein
MKTQNNRLRPVILTLARVTEPRPVPHLNDLIVRAAKGEKSAIAAMAVTFGPILRNLAAAAMEPFAQDAEDVVQDFLTNLVAGQSRIVPEPERSIEWMFGVIRAAARAYRNEREQEQGEGDEPE